MRSTARAAVVAFVLSRALVFGLIVIGAQIAFLQKVYSSSVWETRVVLEWKRVLPETIRVAMVGDAWSYRAIAESGYGGRSASGAPHPTWAFFPLYPLLVRLTGVTGDFAIDGLMASNLALLVAFLLLGAVATKSGSCDADAQRAIFYLAFFPVSYFLSFPLPEAVFLALVLGAFAAAQRDQWWAAALLAALASATRVTGILLFPALLLLAWQSPPRSRRQLLWMALAPTGLLAFMWFLYRHTGNALAFIEAQQLWGRRPAFFLQPLYEYLRNPQNAGAAWNLTLFNFAVAMLLLVAAVALARRRHPAFALYVFLLVLVALSSGSLQSMARYALGAFPLYIWLAALGARPMIDRVITVVSCTLLGWFVALLALRVDFALA